MGFGLCSFSLSHSLFFLFIRFASQLLYLAALVAFFYTYFFIKFFYLCLMYVNATRTDTHTIRNNVRDDGGYGRVSLWCRPLYRPRHSTHIPLPLAIMNSSQCAALSLVYWCFCPCTNPRTSRQLIECDKFKHSTNVAWSCTRLRAFMLTSLKHNSCLMNYNSVLFLRLFHSSSFFFCCPWFTRIWQDCVRIPLESRSQCTSSHCRQTLSGPFKVFGVIRGIHKNRTRSIQHENGLYAKLWKP